MLTVKGLLDVKGRSVYTITPTSTIIEALRLMAQKEIGAVMVVEDDKPIGILSERDVVRKIAAVGTLNLDIEVRELMTSPVFFVGLEFNLDECMTIMTSKHFRHLPVINQGKLVGLISIGDVVKAEMQDRDLLITHLENYISGTGYTQ
jgi:CBS domain-containing protein